MKLTAIERWTLINQYRILEKLAADEGESRYFANCRDVLESGYEGEYRSLQNWTSDEHCLSAEECLEVLNICSMFEALQRGYEALGPSERVHINERDLRFHGFDGNHESTRLGYIRHLRKEGKFERMDAGRHDKFNSHMPTLDGYRRMLAVWEERGGLMTEELTGNDIVAIVSAWPHPDSPLGKDLRDIPEGTVQ